MALTPITINNISIRQPTTLIEKKDFQQTDKYAMDSAMQRNRISTALNPLGLKYVAILTWKDLPLTDFQQLDSIFTTGSGVVYRNPSSKYGSLTFSGLPMSIQESEYVSGDSLLTDYQVTIRQI